MPSVGFIRLIVATAVALSLPLAGGVMNAVAGVAGETPKPSISHPAPIQPVYRINAQRS